MGAILAKIQGVIRAISTVGIVLGWFGWTSAVLGFLTLVGAVIWAVFTDVPPPLILMAGFCMFVAVCSLSLLPGLFRALARVPPPAAPPAPPKPLFPDYGIWGSMQSYTIDQIAYLWIDRNPYALHSPHEASEAEAVRAMLREAVMTGKLALVPMQKENARRAPDGATAIFRDSLVSYAEKFPNPPRFLKSST